MASYPHSFWFIIVFVSANQLLLRRSEADEFVYNGFGGVTKNSNNVSLIQSAELDRNGVLVLTNDHATWQIGRAFYPTPITFKDNSTGKSLSFSTAFAFAIVPRYPKSGGHGFAFVVSPQKELPGATPNQYLGLFNLSNNGNSSNRVFAIEFDTVVDVDFNDISSNHVGVDVNGLTSVDSVNASYFDDHGRRASLDLMSGKTIQAWIDYNSTTNVLNVSLSPSSTKPGTPILSVRVDLSPVLEDTMFVGFSAATGQLTACHYIRGWSFKMNGQAKSLDLASLPLLPVHKNVALIVGVSIFALGVVVCAFCTVSFVAARLNEDDIVEDWELNIGPHRFPYKELAHATEGFKDKQLIGFGGFGRVYKGKLPSSNTEIAVKRISQESRQGLREFMSEIASMGCLRHRNLIHLLGWCRRGDDLLLVYDFMHNGSLDKYIFDQPGTILSWEHRFKIVKDVASGLLYLHEGWEQTVIHRDIKAGNVLLDSDMNGRLGDFGLAKLYDRGSNPDTTRIVGTLGYLAPELTRTGKPTKSSDVFAFGALLLEVVCGRRPIDPKAAAEEEASLVEWVWRRWSEGAILETVDPKLEQEYDETEAVVVLKLGLMCSNSVPGKRPDVRQVVRYLEGEAVLPAALSPPDVYHDKKSVGDDESSEFAQYSSPSTSEKIDNCFVDDGNVDIEAASLLW